MYAGTRKSRWEAPYLIITPDVLINISFWMGPSFLLLWLIHTGNLFSIINVEVWRRDKHVSAWRKPHKTLTEFGWSDDKQRYWLMHCANWINPLILWPFFLWFLFSSAFLLHLLDDGSSTYQQTEWNLGITSQGGNLGYGIT